MGTWATAHGSGDARDVGTNAGVVWEVKLRGPTDGLNKIILTWGRGKTETKRRIKDVS